MQYSLILVKSLIMYLNHALLGFYHKYYDLIAYAIKSITLVGLID